MPNDTPDEIFNYDEDGNQTQTQEEMTVEEPTPPTPAPARTTKGKRKVRRGGTKVQDLMEDDGVFTFDDELTPEDSLADHFKKLDGFLKNLQAADVLDKCKIHLHRIEPKEVEGIPTEGFLEDVQWPTTAPELYEMVSKKYGGGRYKVLFWDEKGTLTVQIHLKLPGIPKLTGLKPIDGVDTTNMTSRERELLALLNSKQRDEDNAKIRAEYEARSAKDKQQSSSELVGLLKTFMLTKAQGGDAPSNELKVILQRQEDLIQDLQRRLEAKNSENAMVQMFRAFAESNKAKESPMNSTNMLEWVKALAPLVLPAIRPKDITENPIFGTLLTKLMDQKATPADELLKKLMDMNLDFTKKVTEIRLEQAMDAGEAGDDGTITPKDILTTASAAFESMMNRFGRPGQPGQPGIPQQAAPRQLPPNMTTPPKQITQEEEEGDEEEEAEQTEEKIQMVQLTEQHRSLLKGSIAAGNPGANFGKLLLQQVPALSQFKEVIKTTDVPGLVKILEPFLTPAVGDEIKGMLLKTDKGKKYLKEAIEYVKANI